MPFTFVHPLAVLPFRNKYFNFSGLILGSMAPDFIYFILFSPSSNIGHTYLGFILFNLPICFLLNYIFYKYIQELFILSMPDFISMRYMYLIKYKNIISNKMDLLKFIYSCLIGMFTHVFWDAFTHKHGVFVEKLELLTKSITIFERNIPFYKIFQHGSTIIGALIIFAYIYRIRDTSSKSLDIKINKTKSCLIILLIQIVTIIFSIGIFVITETDIGIGRLIVTFINSIFIAYLITGFIFQSKYKFS